MTASTGCTPAQISGGSRADGRLAIALEQRRHQPDAIHGIGDRLADMDVVEGRGRMIEGQAIDAERGRGDDIDILQRLPLVDVGNGEIEGAVDIAVLHRQQPGLAIGDRLEDDLLGHRLRSPIVVGWPRAPHGRRARIR